MINENTQTNAEIVVWDEKYATGIELIDTQHKQLIVLTNQLYEACFAKEDVLHTIFKEAMGRMVEYVRFHFNAELKFLNAINYPDYNNHKKMHDNLIQEIISAGKGHSEGKKFVPNNFVRTLRDWILSHIALHDKAFSVYAWEQVKKGTLTLKAMKEIEASIS